MLPRGQRAIVDTNVIIESHRVKCWNALAGYFSMETVEMCCTEAGSGDKGESVYVPVDTEHLRKTARIHRVSTAMIAAAALRASGLNALDPGEKELLAFAITQQTQIVISSPDLRAIRAGHELGIMDRFISLEELVETIGLHPSLRRQYTKIWLAQKRTEITMDSL